jgi:hypothetical protein
VPFLFDFTGHLPELDNFTRKDRKRLQVF